MQHAKIKIVKTHSWPSPVPPAASGAVSVAAGTAVFSPGIGATAAVGTPPGVLVATGAGPVAVNAAIRGCGPDNVDCVAAAAVCMEGATVAVAAPTVEFC